MRKGYSFIAMIVFGLMISSVAHAADPVAHWKFDEGVGASATDSSGNGHTGTISGATYSATVPDVDFADPYSLEFDGVDDGVSTPLSVDNYAEFTLAGWAYPRTAVPQAGWFGANNAFEFIFMDETTLRCWTNIAAVNWSFEGIDDFLNNWHHITCLGDGDAVILYVDGEQVASTPHSHTDNYGGGDDFTIGIGVQNGGASGPFDGFIDDVRVYNTALTPGEMSSLGTGSDEPVDNPIVTAFSPVDNATDVAINTDLSLTFSKDVGWESGNILIKKVDDNTTVETIPVGGGPVSGSGTDTLTINPHDNFDYDTEYYIEIPDTAVRDTVDSLYFAGISDSDTWSFTTEEDTVPPVLTESIDIPNEVRNIEDAIYYFQTSELCEVAVQPPVSSTGTVLPLAEEVDAIGQDIGITLEDMREGGTYSFSFACIDASGNTSNTLSVGPFTIGEKRSQSGGTSVKARVKNLLSTGKQAQADKLKAEHPNIFTTSTDNETTNHYAVGTPVRDLTVGMQGDDVRRLQELLIGQGYSIPAGATSYFFTQTRDALAAYQTANAIAPAVGYFGPITRGQMKVVGIVGLWW